MSGNDFFGDLRDLYQEVILDHGRKPRNFRRLEDADRTSRGDNPMCGDRMELFLKMTPDGHIADAAFQGRGCAGGFTSPSGVQAACTGVSVLVVSSLTARLLRAGKRGVQRMPGERCAFHPAWKFMHAG